MQDGQEWRFMEVPLILQTKILALYKLLEASTAEPTITTCSESWRASSLATRIWLQPAQFRTKFSSDTKRQVNCSLQKSFTMVQESLLCPLLIQLWPYVYFSSERLVSGGIFSFATETVCRDYMTSYNANTDFNKRIYLRVLPRSQSMESCHTYSLTTKFSHASA